MPATKISNRRDLVAHLLGELMYVERRLADSVLAELAHDVRDEELRALLLRHRDETRVHVDRIEQAFRRLDVAPTSNISRSFESAVGQHGDTAGSIVATALADAFHAQSALHTEHWEMAAYRTLLPLAPSEVGELLRPSFDEEGETAKQIVRALDRLAADVG
jgi:ferritin-like metal-binding protein YciE